MKTKILLYFSLTLLFTSTLSSCHVGKRATTTQIETNSYLHFVSDLKETRESQWSIKVDKGTETIIILNKNDERFSKDNLYQIPTGTHEIRIYNNKTLKLSKSIFIGNNETKTIKL
jgi:hypothetical protein